MFVESLKCNRSHCVQILSNLNYKNSSIIFDTQLLEIGNSNLLDNKPIHKKKYEEKEIVGDLFVLNKIKVVADRRRLNTLTTV